MSLPRRRIWVEFLPPSVLAEPATLHLLRRFALEPIVALPPEREDGEMQRALARLAGAGLSVGLWPLLSDAEGYWPSVANAAAFERRVAAALAFSARSGVTPRTLAVDLEPRLPVTKALLDGPRLWTVAGELRRALSPEADEARLRADRVFRALRADLGARGIESLAAIWPVQLLDLSVERALIGGLLGTPLRRGDWDVTCPMLYSSMIRALSPTRSDRLLRWAYGSIRRAQKGTRMSVSLGLVGTGKLGHEPVLPHPDSLALDVEMAKSAGLDDLALFSLEGVLSDEDPERWLRVFS